MNEGKNKQVILINGDNSKWYEQAIFIVKKNAFEKNPPVDFVVEAEKIINSYIAKTSGKTRARGGLTAAKKSGRGAETLINILILATCVLLTVMLFLLI